MRVTCFNIALRVIVEKNYHMRKTEGRTVRSSESLSIANDGSEPQFGLVKVPITLLFVDETIKCGYAFS